MKNIHNENAYYNKIAKNALIDEYKKNDTQARHTYPAGLYIYEVKTDDESIERELMIKSPQHWRAFINDPQLAAALGYLDDADLELIFLYMVYGYTQADLARYFEVHQTVISKRYKRILKELRKFF